MEIKGENVARAHWKLICSMTFKVKKRWRVKAAIKWLKLKERCCTEFREELSKKCQGGRIAK